MHTRSWEAGARGGSRKQTTEGATEGAGNNQILGVGGWGGEPKRETRAATGDPGVRSGGTWGTRENQAGLRGVGGMSRSGGSSTPWGVTPLLNPSPDFSPFPHPDSLNVTDNGSYW